MLNSRFVRMCAACALALFFSYLSNAYLNPSFAGMVPGGKPTMLVFDVVLLVGMACASAVKPRLFRFDGLLIAVVLLAAVGAACSVAPGAPAVVAFVGCTLTQAAWLFSMVVVGVGVSTLAAGAAAACVAVAFLACATLRQLFILVLPQAIGSALYLLAPVLALALVAPEARRALGRFAAGEPYYQASLTNPKSFLPFTHQLFICLLLFRIAPGFALNIGGGTGVSQAAPLALVPFALVAVGIVAKHRLASPDKLFVFASLFVVAGFLLLPLTLGWASQAVLTLLVVGAGIFEVFTWMVLASIARTAPMESVAAFAWGFALVNAGTMAGAGVASFVDASQGDQNMLVLVSAALVFLFVCYVFVGLRRFSFEDALNCVVAPAHPQSAACTQADELGKNAQSSAATRSEVGSGESENESEGAQETTLPSPVETACQQLARTYRLTEREACVMELLAQGRNARFIQDHLCVSYNTVRTHIKHVYAKMNVHSQQEVISALEAQLSNSAS